MGIHMPVALVRIIMESAVSRSSNMSGRIMATGVIGPVASTMSLAGGMIVGGVWSGVVPTVTVLTAGVAEFPDASAHSNTTRYSPGVAVSTAVLLS